MSDFSTIQNKLISDEKMDLIPAAIMTADIINHYDKDVRTAIIDWANGEDVSSFEVEGTKVEDLKYELGCSDFQALAILGAIKTDPDIFEDAVLLLGRDEVFYNGTE